MQVLVLNVKYYSDTAPSPSKEICSALVISNNCLYDLIVLLQDLYSHNLIILQLHRCLQYTAFQFNQVCAPKTCSLFSLWFLDRAEELLLRKSSHIPQYPHGSAPCW